MASGEIAYRLGKAFGQHLANGDKHPTFGAPQVFYDEVNDKYYNKSSGIDNIVDEPATTAQIEGYYNLQGVRSASPWNGINIVRYSDGTTRKAIVR